MSAASTSTFIQGMDNLKANKLVNGENGTLEHISTENSLVDLFFKLMRGMEAEDLQSKVRAILQSVSETPEERTANTTLVDLFVICMQTRDCRGGKGEKSVFYVFFLLLAESFPVTMKSLIPLISHFGSFKDYFTILKMINAKGDNAPLNNIKISILEYIAERLKTDQSLVEKVKSMDHESVEDRYEVRKEISLCAKYCPREAHSFWDKENAGNVECMNLLLKMLYPDSKKKMRKQLYRKQCSSICAFLDIAEQKMCGKRYADITFKKVPSICTKKFAKAFLNEKVKDNSLRHPEDQDRVACRENFVAHICNGKIKGGQIFPHEIVEKIFKDGDKMSVIEQELMKGQWDSMKDALSKQIEEAIDNGAHKSRGTAVDLGKLVALSDVSGSMSGTPMMVSIALGVLISEMASPAFKNRVLTFESSPRWHTLVEGSGIVEKAKSLQRAEWGGSTDLEAALDRIIEVCELKKLGPTDIPDLIIFSDMQFDEADRGARGSNRETQQERIVKKFHDVGIKICGEPYSAPRVIYWNLRSNTVGFPTEATASNVQLLSGYSPSLFKAVLVGGCDEQEEEVIKEEVLEDGAVVVTVTRERKKVTPYETLRRVLDDSRYIDVRAKVSESEELRGFYTSVLDITWPALT